LNGNARGKAISASGSGIPDVARGRFNGPEEI